MKIRIMGDFAIIHAATSYTTADGQQASGRYTDCWARQNGKWLAVSAHVSRSVQGDRSCSPCCQPGGSFALQNDHSRLRRATSAHLNAPSCQGGAGLNWRARCG